MCSLFPRHSHPHWDSALPTSDPVAPEDCAVFGDGNRIDPTGPIVRHSATSFNVPLSNHMGRNMVEHHMAVLRPLIGKEVMLETGDGITTIRTLDGWELHIYNAARLHCAGIVEPLAQPPRRLRLVDYRFDHKTMVAQFSGGVSLTVDVSDSGYSGPEAMQLNCPDGTTVIWN